MVTSVERPATVLPTDFRLEQNYPNPFNPSTNISFSIPSKGFVTLKIYDLLGRQVATIVSEQMPAGSHTRRWDATDVPSGVYFYRLRVGSLTQTKKMVLIH